MKKQSDAELAARLARPDLWPEQRLGVKMHPKQAAVLRDLFKKGGARISLRCGNEVGKTTHVGAMAILYALEILNAQVISTAGVWMQVAQQLMPALKKWAGHFPGWTFLESSIKINGLDRYVGFSTRDEGFAQGFHKQEGRPLLAIIDEAAAVQPGVFNGIDERCNPNHLLVMGSPLDPVGPFYDIETKFAPFYTHHHLSQMDCLTTQGYWIDPATVERKIAKWGKDNPLVQSNVFGEFPSSVAGAVISLGEFDACLNSPPDWDRGRSGRHAFLDFAGGRAKNVFAIRVGNKVWIEKKWVDVNTMSACGEFMATFRKLHQEHGLEPGEVEGDADGLGLPMIDRLREMGFRLLKFHGGGQPRFDSDYQNAISEAWGEGAGQMKRKSVIVCNDADFKAQALSRKLKRNSTGKFQLESKEDMAARGLESPDEADAIFGAMMPCPMSGGRQVMDAGDPLAHNKASIWGEREIVEPREDYGVIPGIHFG